MMTERKTEQIVKFALYAIILAIFVWAYFTGAFQFIPDHPGGSFIFN